MARSTSIPELSTGSLKRMLDDACVDYSILQLMEFWKKDVRGTPHYELLLNDGETLHPAKLDVLLNNLIEEKHLEKLTIFELKKYTCTKNRFGSKVITCHGIELLSPGSTIDINLSLNRSTADISFNVFDISSNRMDTEHCTTQITNSINNANNVERTSIRNETSNSESSLDNVNAGNSSNLISPDEPGTCDTVENLPPSMGTETTLEVSNTSKSSSITYSSNFDTVPKDRLKCNDEANQGVVIPIINLESYLNKCTFMARVVYKSLIKTSQKGGKYIFLSLLDQTAEIRAAAFDNETNLHDLYEKLKINKVYYISKYKISKIKEESQRYNMLKNRYQLVFNNNTSIEIAKDSGIIPYMPTIKFEPISKIKTLRRDQGDLHVNVIGVCYQKRTKTTLDGREVKNLMLNLIDKDKETITLTLWSPEANEFNHQVQNNTVIAARFAKVNFFNNDISLNFDGVSMLFVNPKIPEADQLVELFGNGDRYSASHSPSNELNSQTWKTFLDVKNLGEVERFQDKCFTTKATVMQINTEKSMYRSCPKEGCLKKVNETDNGKFKCDKCSTEYDSFKWSLLLLLDLAEFSDSLSTVAFNDTAEMMISYTGEQLNQMKETNEDKYLNVLQALNFQSFVFKLRSNIEVFNGTSRLKTTVVEANPVDSVSYTEKLVADIQSMERILNSD